MRYWQRCAKKGYEDHKRVANLVKMKNNIFGIPPIIIPVFMVMVSQLSPGDEPVSASVGFGLAGLASLLYTYLGLGSRMQQHLSCAAQYEEIASRIQFELVRRADNRRPVDLFFTEISVKMQILNRDAPDVLVCDFPFCLMSMKYHPEDEEDFTPPVFESVLMASLARMPTTSSSSSTEMQDFSEDIQEEREPSEASTSVP